MISDASPVGTVRSAMKSRPFAPGQQQPDQRRATRARVASRAARRVPRRHATQTAISAPASMNRVDTAKNAGIVSPATLMPRYVEPQIR